MARPRKPRLSTKQIDEELRLISNLVSTARDNIYFHKQEKSTLQSALNQLTSLRYDVEDSIIVCDSR